MTECSGECRTELHRHHNWMAWQVRLLLGIRSLARAGPSGFVHPRRRCTAFNDVRMAGVKCPANAGRTTGRAARRFRRAGRMFKSSRFPERRSVAQQIVLPKLVAGRRPTANATGDTIGSHRTTTVECERQCLRPTLVGWGQDETQSTEGLRTQKRR